MSGGWCSFRNVVLTCCFTFGVAAIAHAANYHSLKRDVPASTRQLPSLASRHMISCNVAVENCEVTDLAFSPDGKLAAWITSAYQLSMCEVATGRSAVLIGGIGKQGNADFSRVGFSKQSDLLVAGRKGTVEVWEIATGVNRAVYRPDDDDRCYDRLWIATNGMFAAVNDLQSPWKRVHLRAPLGEKPLVDNILEVAKIHTAAFTPDGSRFAMLAERPSSRQLVVLRWDADTRRPLPPIQLSVPREGNKSMVYSIDGRYLACSFPRGSKAEIVVWDVTGENAKLVSQWSIPGRSEIAFSADGRLVTAGGGFSIGNTNPDWSTCCAFRGSSDRALFEVSVNGNIVASFLPGDEEKVLLVDAASGIPLQTCPLTRAHQNMHLSHNGRHLMCVSSESFPVVTLWSPQDRSKVAGSQGNIKGRYRFWKRYDGTETEMELRYVRTEGTIVTLGSRQGREYRVNCRALSIEDQNYLLAPEGNPVVSIEQPVFRPGDCVVTKTYSTPMTLLDGTKTGIDMGEVLVLQQEHADQLLVSDSQNTGWIARSAVVLLEDANACFSMQIVEDPDNPLSWAARARMLLNARKYDSALEDLSQAMRRSDAEPLCYNLRGNCHYQRQEWAEAVADFTRAIELDRTNAKSLSNRSRAYLSQGTVAKAMADINEAVRLEPRNWQFRHQRGLVCLVCGELGEACAEFTRVLQLAPHCASAYRDRALARLEQRDFESAQRDITKALTLAPNMPAAHLLRARISCYFGHFEAALKDVSQAIAIDENHEGALTFRTQLYLSLGRNDEAKQDAEDLLAFCSSTVKSVGYTVLGVIDLRAGRDTEAIVKLRKATEYNPAHAAAHFNLGIAYWKLTDYDQAQEAWGQAVELDPSLHAAVDELFSESKG